MKNLAIIPARSGSKRLKDKNIKTLKNKPLIAYTIEAAKNSGMFDSIMVSTDSEKYADIARKFGAEVPFLRSMENSLDSTSTWDTVNEVLEQYKRAGQVFHSFCVLQPTSPLRTAADIRNAYKLFEEKATVAVVSVCEAEHSPFGYGSLDDTASLENFIPVENIKNRQINGKFYRINGAIYILKTEEFYRERYPYRKGSYAYIMKQEASVDIDTELDFRFADFLMQDDWEDN